MVRAPCAQGRRPSAHPGVGCLRTSFPPAGAVSLFGAALSTSGAYVAVGAANEAGGAAYVFDLEQASPWDDLGPNSAMVARW